MQRQDTAPYKALTGKSAGYQALPGLGGANRVASSAHWGRVPCRLLGRETGNSGSVRESWRGVASP